MTILQSWTVGSRCLYGNGYAVRVGEENIVFSHSLYWARYTTYVNGLFVKLVLNNENLSTEFIQ